MWQLISKEISTAIAENFSARTCRPVGGGCINSAWLAEDGALRFFVKTNRASNFLMFEAEAAGLREIAEIGALRVPNPICMGIAEDASFLVLEFLDLGAGGEGRAEELGRRLAAMHRASGTQYGWRRDNTIGATPQINLPSENWPEFWRDKRLGYQLELAARNGYSGALQRRGELLRAGLGEFFAGYSPAPSLLHGDLWGGNYAYTRSGEPVVFDPAVYYGDRETDLAMTELFGGFPAAFYAAYREAYPLDSGYCVRRTLYNLYHVLNHLNLFGGGYLEQAEDMIARLLAEAG